MERNSLKDYKALFGKNYIGPEELVSISSRLQLHIPETIPQIPWALEELKLKYDTHLLVLVVENFVDGLKISIISLRDKLGVNPDDRIPCLYNQDWYVKESFAKKTTVLKWLLISRNVIDSTRALRPDQIQIVNSFPSAIDCTYTFFVNYYYTGGEKLWEHDYVWCSDFDANNDRIYVGRYTDISGINKDGFEIHRHLSIKKSYGAVECT